MSRRPRVPLALKRAFILGAVLWAAAATGYAATLSVTPYAVTPVADGDAQSARVYQVIATEKEDSGGVKVWVYPLLWDSPEPPPAHPMSEMFGSLPPGQYRFGMRIRVLEAPTDLRVSWIPDPNISGIGTADNQVQQSVVISDLSPSRWYQVSGDVTVTGTDDWNGRTTIALISTSGNPARRLTVWLDDIELEQLSDTPLDPDGCDPHCYRNPLDFEAPGDTVGSDPARLHHLTFRGQHILAGVSHNTPWQTLPSWFEQTRVQVGTRLKARDCVFGQVAVNNTWPVTADTFLNAATYLEDMGVDIWTRHVKTAAEGPWWPTEVPSNEPRFRPTCVQTAPSGSEDIAAEIIARAHAAGTRQVAYYWMSTEDEIRLNYPVIGGEEWSAFDDQGLPIASTNRGLYVTQNSPYPAEVVEGRLRELVQRGADAIKFDATHNPETGDFSIPSQDDFAAAGFGMFPSTENFDDPQYHGLLELYALTLRDAFRRYHFAVHDEDPDTVMVVGSSTLPALLDPQPMGAFAEDQQIVKGEWQQTWKRLRWFFVHELPTTISEPDHKFHLPPRDVQSAFGYSVLRDAALGRPGHVWVFRPAMNPCAGAPGANGVACDPITGVDSLLSSWQLSVASGALMTYGNVANLDLLERNIQGGDDRYRQALTFGNSAGPGSVLAGLRPHCWIGIHFNEHARQEIYATPGLSKKQKHEKAWNEVLAPAVWAFATLQAHGVPAVIVSDEQLARGELYGYAPGDDNAFEILFLPTNNLSRDADEAVTRFAVAGGEVIRSATANNGQPWIWHALPDGAGGWDTAPREAAAENFLELLGLWTDGRVLDSPVEVFFAEEIDPETATPRQVSPHIAAYSDPDGSGRLVVAINNRWDWMLNMEEAISGCTSSEPSFDCLSPQERFDYVPTPVGKGKVFLRRGILQGNETFRYATTEDPVWKTIPASHVNVATTANGVRVILSMDDGDANSDDDITFRSTLLIEAIPPQP